MDIHGMDAKRVSTTWHGMSKLTDGAEVGGSNRRNQDHLDARLMRSLDDIGPVLIKLGRIQMAMRIDQHLGT